MTMLEIGRDMTRVHCFFRTGPEQEEHLRTARAKAADHLEAVLVSFDEAAREIQTDRRLTLKGQREETERLAQRADALLRGEVEPILKAVRQAVERAEPILTAQHRHRLPDGMDRAGVAQMEGEIRTRALGMTPTQRAEMYTAACKANDVLTVRALELAPPSFGLLDADTVAEGAELHAAARAPREFQSLQERRATLAAMEADYNRAVRTFATAATAAVQLLGGPDAQPQEAA